MVHTRCLVFIAACACLLPVAEAAGDSVVRLAAELGITPESVVLADLDGQSGTLLGRLESNIELRDEISQRRAEMWVLYDEREQLERRLRSDPRDMSLKQEYAALHDEILQGEQTIDSALSSLRSAVLTGIGEEELELLDRWVETIGRRVPSAFRVLDLNEREWRDLEGSYIAEQRAARRSESLPPVHAQRLAGVRADLAVAAAQARLDARLAATTALFKQFDHEE